MLVERNPVLLVEGGEGDVLLLLLSHVPKVLEDVSDKGYDVVFLYAQLEVVGVHLLEFHELVDQLGQPSRAAFDGLHRLLGDALWLGIRQFVGCSGDDGQWGPELVGHVCEEVDPELIDLLVHFHLLVEVEPLSPVAVDIVSDCCGCSEV